MTSLTVRTARTTTSRQAGVEATRTSGLRRAVKSLLTLRSYWRSDMEPYSSK
jgi:hypothetical protein